MIVVPRLWFTSDSRPSGVSESILRKDPRQSKKPTQNLSPSRASKRVTKDPILSNDCVWPVAAGTDCLNWEFQPSQTASTCGRGYTRYLEKVWGVSSPAEGVGVGENVVDK